MDVLVTYDINTQTPEGERRLSRVAAVCESYGVRMQYSVFECRLSETGLRRLWVELAEIVDHNLDSVNFYRFPGALADSRETLGIRKARDAGRPWIV
jgi:CRISPR-associated protein Cas2